MSLHSQAVLPAEYHETGLIKIVTHMLQNRCPWLATVDIPVIVVDFGDPVKKVALECDGKQFHNAEKDKTRDMYLNSLGWTVFRVTGKECHRPEPDKEDLYFKKLDGIITEEEYDQIMRDWAMNTSDGVISAIGSVYYGKRFSKEYPFEESLAKHSYTYPV